MSPGDTGLKSAELKSEGRSSLVLLLGRPDSPTDGVEDYSQLLAATVRKRGHPVSVVRLRWDQGGWLRALATLRRHLRTMPGAWILVQFTPRAWSRTLFTSWILVLGRFVRRSGCYFGVTVHDPFPIPGARLRDRIRHRYQARVLTRLARTADAVFTTLDQALVPWSASGPASRDVQLLPTGSAVPAVAPPTSSAGFTVGVFCVSYPVAEAEIIAKAVRALPSPERHVRLLVFGRNAVDTGPLLTTLLQDTDIDISIDGLLPADELSNRLGQLDALLFVRDGVSSRRSTVAAGLAHGLPIVGFRSIETGWPLTEAGLLLAEQGDVQTIAGHLEAVAGSASLAATLRRKSETAYRTFFSWDAIADRLETELARKEDEGAVS